MDNLDWEKAKIHLNMVISEYCAIGFFGSFALNLTLLPLKKRLDTGERTNNLYDEIMECE